MYRRKGKSKRKIKQVYMVFILWVNSCLSTELVLTNVKRFDIGIKEVWRKSYMRGSSCARWLARTSDVSASLPSLNFPSLVPIFGLKARAPHHAAKQKKLRMLLEQKLEVSLKLFCKTAEGFTGFKTEADVPGLPEFV